MVTGISFSLALLLHIVAGELSLSFHPEDLSLQLGDSDNVSLMLSAPAPEDLNFNFTYRDANGNYKHNLSDLAVEPVPSLVVPAAEKGPFIISVVAHRPGHVYMGLNETGASVLIKGLDRVVCNVLVMHFRWLNVAQGVIGWAYFLAWSVSFYPQAALNWRRKSVIGLNLDFLCLNIVGFFVYSVFNLTFYFSPIIMEEYTRIHPLGVIPVMINDIFFAVHAFVISSFTGFQVLIYERGDQRVSRVCIAILSLITVYSLLNAILAAAHVMTWLTFLYNFSYVKLFITLIKYIPQAIMNCRRKSTVGWSIANICLDMTGGLLSFLQMFIVAYNFDDWSGGFSSPTKLGLGLFSILFDLFFMVQHWCLYPHRDTEADLALVLDSPETTKSQSLSEDSNNDVVP